MADFPKTDVFIIQFAGIHISNNLNSVKKTAVS